ncbi:hypothetical protein GC088_02330 [Arthrobacter sp. JZ12]|uniref:hypothetical protein n=1 Tax=Arthrobacter sp. JZ12 TaxID=2654190 RepID=UPI002B4852C7|nr:hypothetical protein [Arthrobacter sp. JZ12]WRH24052.1 hypothetical protein GC088_02330 [Arthrobacter sp. JZ12]
MTQLPHPLPDGENTHAPAPGQVQAQRLRQVLLIAAVVLAVVGLLSLLAVLVSAWMGAEPWPGFVTAAYFFLPLGFLLMLLNVVLSVILRGRN